MKKLSRVLTAAVLMAAAGQASAQTAWGIWNNGTPTQTIVTFSVTAPGTFTTIGATGIANTTFINCLEFGPGGTNLYLAGNVATNFLYDVSQVNGLATNPRGSGLFGTETLGDMSYDHFAGRMLAIGTPGVAAGGAHLYTVNLTTGVLTNLGAVGGGYTEGFSVSLAVRPSDGLIFAHGVETDRYYTINPTTLVATALPVFGFDTNFGQGASFNPASGILYHAMLTTTGGNQNRLATIDQVTGVPTFIGTLGVPLTQIGDIAFKNTAVPCYADCDGVGGLTGNDFQCFLDKFVANASYADCDGVGGLTGNDFQCFLNKFVAGCS